MLHRFRERFVTGMPGRTLADDLHLSSGRSGRVPGGSPNSIVTAVKAQINLVHRDEHASPF